MSSARIGGGVLQLLHVEGARKAAAEAGDHDAGFGRLVGTLAGSGGARLVDRGDGAVGRRGGAGHPRGGRRRRRRDLRRLRILRGGRCGEDEGEYAERRGGEIAPGAGPAKRSETGTHFSTPPVAASGRSEHRMTPVSNRAKKTRPFPCRRGWTGRAGVVVLSCGRPATPAGSPLVRSAEKPVS